MHSSKVLNLEANKLDGEGNLIGGGDKGGGNGGDDDNMSHASS
jgi:hypothetical protein